MKDVEEKKEEEKDNSSSTSTKEKEDKENETTTVDAEGEATGDKGDATAVNGEKEPDIAAGKGSRFIYAL